MEIKSIIYSNIEPKSTNSLWLKPVKEGVCIYIFDGGWKPLRVVNDNDTISIADDTVVDVEGIDKKTDEIINDMYYHDLYVGTGSEVQDILIPACHLKEIEKGTKFSFSDNEGKRIFIALSLEDTPKVAMNGIMVPILRGEDSVVGGTTYHTWYSENLYSGDIEIVLL